MPLPGLLALLALALLVLCSPPLDSAFWGVNGFRSSSPAARAGIVIASAALGLAASLRPGSRRAWAAIALVLAVALAFPLRERIHLLGDTDARIRAVAIAHAELIRLDLRDWTHWLHAQPVDVLVNWFFVLLLRNLGLSVVRSIQLVSLGLALLFFAGIWRLSGSLTRRDGPKLGACCALAVSGCLEAFAGYAESAGLLLAVTAWWWSFALEPVRSRASAARLAAVTTLAALCHRQGFALAVPLLVRALRASLPDDRPHARRELLAFTGVGLAATLGITLLLPGGSPVGQDLSDLVAVVRGWLSGRRLPAWTDLANLLLLVAPMAMLAPALRAGQRDDSPQAATARRMAGTVALVLLPAFAVILVGPHELGAHRDWDIMAMLGLSLTTAAVASLLAAPAGRAWGALRASVPVLALAAGSWVAVNADATASEARAEALAGQASGVSDEARSAVEMLLGQRLMNRGDARGAAPHFERAYELAPNPRLLLVAAEARARAGDLTAARADLARAWASHGLNERNQESARTIERMIDEMERGVESAPAPSPP